MIGDKRRKPIPRRAGRKPADFFILSHLWEAEFNFFFKLVKADLEHGLKKK